LYVSHVLWNGKRLYHACKADLEGIVCKPQTSRYTSSTEETSEFKIKNPNYSQAISCDEMFDQKAELSPWAGCGQAMRGFSDEMEAVWDLLLVAALVVVWVVRVELEFMLNVHDGLPEIRRAIA